MKTRFTHLVRFAVAALAFGVIQSEARAASLLASIDFDGEGGPTQAGFSSFLLSNGASQAFGAITVALSGPGALDGRDRGAISESGSFTESNLLRDFVFAGGETTITISGLTAGNSYDLSVWSYEHAVVIPSLVEDWFANSTLVAASFPYANGAPTTNDQYRIDFTATANGSGEIVVLGTTPPADGTVVRLNGLQISGVIVPEPSSIFLASSIGTLSLLVYSRRRAMVTSTEWISWSGRRIFPSHRVQR